MGKLSSQVKSAAGRPIGLYVDDILAFDNMQTTGQGRNNGHVQRNTLFAFSQDRPVKTISQLNLDISGCQKFWPAGVKGSVEMEHTSDDLRCENFRFNLNCVVFDFRIDSMSTKSPKLNLESCTLIVTRYTPTPEMQVHLHNLFSERGAIDYPFIQVKKNVKCAIF